MINIIYFLAIIGALSILGWLFKNFLQGIKDLGLKAEVKLSFDGKQTMLKDRKEILLEPKIVNPKQRLTKNKNQRQIRT